MLVWLQCDFGLFWGSFQFISVHFSIVSARFSIISVHFSIILGCEKGRKKTKKDEKSTEKDEKRQWQHQHNPRHNMPQSLFSANRFDRNGFEYQQHHRKQYKSLHLFAIWLYFTTSTLPVTYPLFSRKNLGVTLGLFFAKTLWLPYGYFLADIAYFFADKPQFVFRCVARAGEAFLLCLVVISLYFLAAGLFALYLFAFFRLSKLCNFIKQNPPIFLGLFVYKILYTATAAGVQKHQDNSIIAPVMEFLFAYGVL